MTPRKLVYAFADGFADGRADMSAQLGGKGANLAEMCLMGLPVPPGFTLTTDVCTHFNAHDRAFPEGLKEQVEAALARLSEDIGMVFGDTKNPLLVSVRSGSRASMPGMMDTVLNLGLNDETVESMAAKTGEARFAWDSYRRFQQMYGDVVMGIEHDYFEDIIDDYKFENALSLDADLEADDWRDICTRFGEMMEQEAGHPFPQDAHAQLWGAIGAVFDSWNNRRAQTYRKLHDIPDDWGTAVNVQSMVFGNLGQTSATGVAFTRNPSTGAKEIYGEYLINAQGEDVVSGIHTPLYLTQKAREEAGTPDLSLEETMPAAYADLVDVFARLESHFADMQDVEFTIQNGRLFILQTRNGKRTVMAGLKIAVDMVAEGVITQEAAVLRIEPEALEQLLHPTLDPRAKVNVLTKGLPASPGAASGKIIFSSDQAEELAAQGEKMVLVRMETSPEDIHGMYAAQAILTSRGGMTSHAAVVARGLGRPCVSGAGQLIIDYDTNTARIGHGEGAVELKQGDVITVDGTSGRVMAGEVATLEPALSGDFGTLMDWADAAARMKVRTNAETLAEAQRARKFGAQGIGLCRTEHMFFDAQRIFQVRQMILAQDAAHRQTALQALEPEQRADFAKLFEIMDGLPVTIRLLDPPLHEFLPAADDNIDALAEALDESPKALRATIQAMAESNPMLGHRGSRLAITTPEIYAMQLRAIFGAMQDVRAKVQLEIMFPLIAEPRELEALIDMVPPIAQSFDIEASRYQLGTMIEVPRAAFVADELAAQVGFFSFGTNDLTQTTFGLSRDDAGGFLPHYVAKGLLPRDPFSQLDQAGVGALMAMACDKARGQRADIKLGICGEHGGDPSSIGFCEKLGLDYVSCSPFRVPIARLAVAQSAIRAKSSG
jgi:pyruvate,orthophosphate dikinase